MEKIMRIGTIKIDNKTTSIFVKAIYKDGRLSILGVIGPNRFGNSRGSSGQINIMFAHRNPAQNDARCNNLITPHDIRFAPGWTPLKWLDLLTLWEKYHLNDLQPRCLHQRTLEYDATMVGTTCPICGFNGRTWKKMTVPAWVITYIESMPNTDKTPAWI